MDLFDQLIENFSEKSLHKRVWGVVIVGFAICILSGIGGFFFLTRVFTISVTGAGGWTATEPSILEVTLKRDDIERIQRETVLQALILPLDGDSYQTTVEIVAIDPASNVLKLDAPKVPAQFHELARFDVRLIIIQKPFWRFLWGENSE